MVLPKLDRIGMPTYNSLKCLSRNYKCRRA